MSTEEKYVRWSSTIERETTPWNEILFPFRPSIIVLFKDSVSDEKIAKYAQDIVDAGKTCALALKY